MDEIAARQFIDSQESKAVASLPRLPRAVSRNKRCSQVSWVNPVGVQSRTILKCGQHVTVIHGRALYQRYGHANGRDADPVAAVYLLGERLGRIGLFRLRLLASSVIEKVFRSVLRQRQLGLVGNPLNKGRRQRRPIQRNQRKEAANQQKAGNKGCRKKG